MIPIPIPIPIPGYGTFAPTTVFGQIFLVIYALIGIPAAGSALAVIAERALYVFTWLSQVGGDKTLSAFNQFDDDGSGELDKDEFAAAVKLLGYDLNQHQFKKLWDKVDDDKSGLVDLDEFRLAVKYMHADVTEAAGRTRRITITVLGIFGWVGIGMIIFTLTEGWAPEVTFYFLFVSLTTVGLGDFFPQSSAGLIFLLFFAMVGLGLVAVLLTLIQGLLEDYEAAREMAIKVNKDKKKIEQLRMVPVFAELSDAHCQMLLERVEEQQFNSDRTLIREGSDAKTFFVLLAGTVKLAKKNIEFCKLLTGPSFFGESALSKNKVSEATVTSEKGGIHVLCLAQEDWQTLKRETGIRLSDMHLERKVEVN